MRLRVLTYNIHRAIGVDRRFAPERVVEILARHNADIVMLQEVDHSAPRSRQLDLAGYLARQLKYGHHAVGLNVALRKGKYGNATLSRFPIGRQRNIDLTIGRYKARGAQHTQIHVTRPRGATVTIDVFNVHLSLLARLRQMQVARLLACADLANLPDQAPCIIAGDMNDWRGLLGPRLFAPAGFQCATGRRHPETAPIRTFPSMAPTGALDKVFYRGNLRVRLARRSRLRLARVASDHLPLLVDFTLPE